MPQMLCFDFTQKHIDSPHCQAECKQISMWQKGLVGQGRAGLTLKFNFHCLIQ